jgi:hypothetical protein
MTTSNYRASFGEFVLNKQHQKIRSSRIPGITNTLLDSLLPPRRGNNKKRGDRWSAVHYM